MGAHHPWGACPPVPDAASVDPYEDAASGQSQEAPVKIPWSRSTVQGLVALLAELALIATAVLLLRSPEPPATVAVPDRKSVG